MNNTKLPLVSKSKITAILQERNIASERKIDEETAVEIAKTLGAQSVISGSIAALGDNYRFRIQVLSVANGTVQGMQSLNVKRNDILADLLGKTKRPAPVQASLPQPAVSSINADTAKSSPIVKQALADDRYLITYKDMIIDSSKDVYDTTYVIDVVDKLPPKPASAPVNTQPSYSSAAHSEVKAAKSSSDMGGSILVSFRGGLSAGVAAAGGMGTFEFGGIGGNGFYMTGTGNFGANVSGGGLNIGGMVGGEKAAKAVFGTALGCWKNHVDVKFVNGDNNSNEIYDLGFGGGFMKLLFGNSVVNFDITTSLLLGMRKSLKTKQHDYYSDYYNYFESGFTTIWQIGAGLTFTGKKGG
jgi:hypothetical protein